MYGQMESRRLGILQNVNVVSARLKEWLKLLSNVESAGGIDQTLKNHIVGGPYEP